MVSVKANATLPISEFYPRCMLHNVPHAVRRLRFPVIDYNNHLDAQDSAEILKIMDACGIENIVNITMMVGNGAIVQIERCRTASAKRFSTIGWMDWNGADSPDFSRIVEFTLERIGRLMEHCIAGFKFSNDLGLSVRDVGGELICVDDARVAPVFDRLGALGIPAMMHIGDPEAFFLPIDANHERYVLVDSSTRASELGRQPYSARKFCLSYADRILFGADLVPEIKMCRSYYQFLQTDDEYFEYPMHASRQGRWNIYGLYLPEDVLRKVYSDNALNFSFDLAKSFCSQT
jgi:hypothetical protein